MFRSLMKRMAEGKSKEKPRDQKSLAAKPKYAESFADILSKQQTSVLAELSQYFIKKLDAGLADRTFNTFPLSCLTSDYQYLHEMLEAFIPTLSVEQVCVPDLVSESEYKQMVGDEKREYSQFQFSASSKAALTAKMDELFLERAIDQVLDEAGDFPARIITLLKLQHKAEEMRHPWRVVRMVGSYFEAIWGHIAVQIKHNHYIQAPCSHEEYHDSPKGRALNDFDAAFSRFYQEEYVKHLMSVISNVWIERHIMPSMLAEFAVLNAKSKYRQLEQQIMTDLCKGQGEYAQPTVFKKLAVAQCKAGECALGSTSFVVDFLNKYMRMVVNYEAQIAGEAPKPQAEFKSTARAVADRVSALSPQGSATNSDSPSSTISSDSEGSRSERLSALTTSSGSADNESEWSPANAMLSPSFHLAAAPLSCPSVQQESVASSQRRLGL